MKFKVSKQIKAAIVIVSLLLQLLPVLQLPVTAAGIAGELADFELKIDGIGSNIINTIVYRPGYPEGATVHGNIPNSINLAPENEINIYFKNERQYISGGGTAECDEYTWSAKSNSTKVLDIRYVHKQDATNVISPTGDNTSPADSTNHDYYMRIVPKAIGTAVITVTAYISDTEEAIKRTFTLRVIDASKHGKAEPTFVKDGNSFVPSETNHVQVPLNGKTVNFAVDKLLGYDYTTLGSSSYEKSIVNYSWSASLPANESGSSDAILTFGGGTADNPVTSISSQTIKSGSGQKNIEITPLKEGTVTLTFTFAPTDQTVKSIFGESIVCDVVIDVVNYVNAVDFDVEVVPDAYLVTEQSAQSASDELSIVPINYLDIFTNDVEEIVDAPETSFESNNSSESGDTAIPTTEPSADPTDTDFTGTFDTSGISGIFDAYTTEAGNPPPDPDITITLKDFTAIYGESDTDRTYFSNFNSVSNNDIEQVAEITGYSITYPINRTGETATGSNVKDGEITKTWSKSTSNPTPTGDSFLYVGYDTDGDGSSSTDLLLEFGNINLKETFDVTITVTTRIYKCAVGNERELLYYYYDYTKSTKKIVTVHFINASDNGKIASIKVLNNGSAANTSSAGTEIFDGDTINGYVGTNSSTESDQLKITVTVDELKYFNISEEPDDYIESVTEFGSDEYEFTATSSDDKKVEVRKLGEAESSEDDDTVESGESGGSTKPTFELIPKAKGTSTITIKVTKTIDGDGGSPTITEYTFKFTVNVLEMGVIPEDEGKIQSVELKSPTKGKVAQNTRIYLAPQDKLEISITSVLELSANAKAPNYTQEAKEYVWSVAISSDSESSVVALDSPVENDMRFNSKDRKSMSFTALDIPYDSGSETNRAKITITVFPADTTIANVSKQISFTIIVNELGGIFKPEVDYENEVVRIQTDKIGDNYTHYSYSNDGPMYMYCLKAVAEGANQASEKWYPMMSDEIDISTLVPKSGTSSYRLGIRLLNKSEMQTLGRDITDTDVALKDASGNYPSDYRRVVLLNPRKALTSAQKKDVYFDDGQIKLRSSSTLTQGDDTIDIYYQIGMSSFIKASISKTNGIKIDSAVAPLGGKVQVKIAGITDDDTSSFATVPVKVKIPAANKKPKIKYNEKKKSYTGFSSKLEWSTDLGNPDGWTEITDKKFKSVQNGNFASTFGDITPDSNGYCILYVRTKATYKKNGVLSKPASEPIVLKIPADRYDNTGNSEE